jgi:predicted nucleotidyltransferase
MRSAASVAAPRDAGRWRSRWSRVSVNGTRYRRHMIDEATIDEAARRLWDAVPSRSRVILFGSHARGEAGDYSDLDFLVVEPEVEDAAAESVRLRRALRGLPLAADIIVVSEQRVREWQGVRSSLIGAALAEGRELAA